VKLSIIGAGAVGQTLGRLAREAGYKTAEVVCRSQRSARLAVGFIGAGDPQSATRARLSRVDLVIISTPDDRIEEAVEIVLGNASRTGRPVVLHTSGALASDALHLLAAEGFPTGSCHPLQTFESPARAVLLAPRSYFCVEGDSRARRVARKFVRDIGARHFEIPTSMKALYHAAAVMASGGVTALASISFDLLTRCGLSESESRKVMLPLVEGTIASIRAVGPQRALTGPVRRGDARTVERNLNAVAAIDPDWLELYRLLAERACALAEGEGAPDAVLAKLRSLLKAYKP
jgi:predicted short-subunit dehydrogenase-like oxidoreductase (DUF2520 family)